MRNSATSPNAEQSQNSISHGKIHQVATNFGQQGKVTVLVTSLLVSCSSCVENFFAVPDMDSR